MTDKERLEEIIDDMPYSIRYSGELEPLIDYVKEQAERVQELEEHLQMSNQYVKKEREINTRLKEQNKRYRATINVLSQILKDAIHSLDYGEKVQGLEYGVKMARKALEESE